MLVSKVCGPFSSELKIGSYLTLIVFAAVRKNRYVILPLDFEEAYKSTVRKGDDVMEFCKCVMALVGEGLLTERPVVWFQQIDRLVGVCICCWPKDHTISVGTKGMKRLETK